MKPQAFNFIEYGNYAYSYSKNQHSGIISIVVGRFKPVMSFLIVEIWSRLN